MEKQPRVPIMESFMQEDLEDFIFRGEEESDLSYWEFINSSDADSDDNLSQDSILNGFVSWHSSISSPRSPQNNPIEKSPVDNYEHDLDNHHVHEKYPENDVEYGEEHHTSNVDNMFYDDEDDGDEEDDGYDLDDELVPWYVSDKFGRQRMRKLGKRSFAKMNNSKRSPHLYMKPGCVYGKHGLGLKHSC